MRISGAYQRLNRELHTGKGAGWGKGGTKFLTPILDIIHDQGVESVLDYGCGKGNLVRAIIDSGTHCDGYDPCHPDWDVLPVLPTGYDMVVSTDVLEHIEPQFLSTVIDHMAGLADRIGFFVVCTVPAVKVLPNGQNAHLIVEPASWWAEKLEDHFPGIRLVAESRTTSIFTWERA